MGFLGWFGSILAQLVFFGVPVRLGLGSFGASWFPGSTTLVVALLSFVFVLPWFLLFILFFQL